MNASPCQRWGFRFSMIFTLASLCLVVPVVVSAVAADGDGDGGQRFTIAIFSQRERDDAVVNKVMEALKRIKANNPMFGDPEKGQGPYARVTVRPGASSKRVAAAVEVLLDAGISKVIVETRK